MVTEFVNFKKLETTTDEQLFSTVDNMISGFMKKQDGFIDAELVKSFEGNGWSFIYHFENPEKVKAVGINMRSNKEFGEFIALVVPGSITVSMNQQLKVFAGN